MKIIRFCYKYMLLFGVVLFVNLLEHKTLRAAQPRSGSLIVQTKPVGKVKFPTAGDKRTIKSLWGALNKGVDSTIPGAQCPGTFLIISDANGNPVTHEALSSKGGFDSSYKGSKSVDAAFGAGFTGRLPLAQEVTLVKDQDLITKMQGEGRLPLAAAGKALSSVESALIDKVSNRLVVYFIYNVNGKNYRFYLNDPCPARKIVRAGQPDVYPIKTTVVDKFDLK